MEHQLFHQPSTTPVIVCKLCEYGVRPKEVSRHLQSANHRMPKPKARQIAEAVQQWERTAECDEWQPLLVVNQPLPNLPVYSDGILCEQGPMCQFVARSISTMRVHWRDHHSWVAPTNRGGRRRQHTSSAAEQQIQQFTRIVRCQRAFNHGLGSHYIRVQTLGAEAIPGADLLAMSDHNSQVIDQMERAYAEREELPQVIVASQRDETNPWLRRTQWAVYLQGINPHDLVDCVRAPDPESVDQTEQATYAIWNSMAAVARISQLICTKTSHTIRCEAVRTERDRLPHQPLQAYMDGDNVKRHTVPWQQILMFSKRQRAAWATLWRLAQAELGASPIVGQGRAGHSNASQGRAGHSNAGQDRAGQSNTGQANTGHSNTGQANTGHSNAGQGIEDLSSSDQSSVHSGSDSEDQQVQITSESPFQLTPLDSACLDFCIELLNHRTKVEDYESALICASAVLGRGEAGWGTAQSYPPILSKVIKIARFMVVHKALKLDPTAEKMIHQLATHQMAGEWDTESPLDSPDFTFLTQTTDDWFYNDDGGLDQGAPQSSHFVQFSQGHSQGQSESNSQSESYAHTQGYNPPRHHSQRSFREWVTEMVSQFMVRGTNSPMQWLLDLRTYGLKIHYNSTATGHVGWMNQDQLLYQHYSFTMGDFRGFTHGLVSSTRQILHEELLFSQASSVPTIPWQAMFDDPTETAHGWSFLKDTRTVWPVAGSEWMVNRVRNERPLQHRFIESSAGRLRMSNVHSYLQRVVHFREKLAIAIHVSGGQPARAPELLSIRHYNTDSGGHRNVFVEDGLVAFVTQYHKGFYSTNDVKVIHRYLPREVGELVVWYLWLVLPFVERLEAYTQKVRGEASDAETTGPRRQAYLWSPDPGTGRQWSSERLREALKRESTIGLNGHAINLHAYRDIAIGISRRFMRPSSIFPNNAQQDSRAETSQEDDEDGINAEQWMGHIADLQAAHSSHVAGMIYGRGITEQPGTTAHRREMFRLSSTDWHRFLGFVSADDGGAESALGLAQPSPWQKEAEMSRTERRWQLAQAAIEPEMQRMIGNTGLRLRGVQAPALAAIQQGQSPVVAVMPTGGGKSLLFMLPAWISPRGVTVVVVPLIALRGDLVHRCRQLGIACVEWESRRPADQASIVLVTPESAITEDFMTFLNRQRLGHRLDRIVIDECHVVLNDQSQFRPAMAQLGRLIVAQAQMIYLTATLPPAAEDQLFRRLRTTREKAHMFRARTHRTNVAYRLWQPNVPSRYRNGYDWIERPEIVRFIQDRVWRARCAAGRVVIYGPTTKIVEHIAQIVGSEAYHSRVLDRPGVLARFQAHPTGVVAATSALVC
ncbi:uncharacterized protein N7529_001349 [Penicillium soppii]|uniref:uncharacterized protein n=1 Tax=Penicillium soppii TaxID=69789 RepID=UPI0025492D8D|nr:uncharacterized protein N7529_005438 [Penicillium soppii]XP_057101567.1 uncharacterized protein N7529_001349 [Penicillium soppii]KAJ5863522.1 hypothetical protein N7529_005438 [Penicillium soppii]KAJ5875765.1 hypothetical protein N7529_001349 [Penicillium soppii]